MRVTQAMLQQTLLSDLDRARAALARTQEQASSGLSINRPSDDPAGAARAAVLRSNLSSAAQLARNIERTSTTLTVSEQVLAETGDVLARARELAIQGASDTQDADTRSLLAEEVASLHEQLLSLGNTRTGGAHIFSGFASATPAFSASGPFTIGLPPPTVTFAGDSNEIQIEIEEGVRLGRTFDGRRVFMGDADGDGATDVGSEDLFETLETLWDALATDDATAVGNALDRIDASQDQILRERAKLGGRTTRLEAARDALSRTELELQRQLSETQDADSVRVFSDLMLQETRLQAALQVTADVIQPSLLDFLR